MDESGGIVMAGLEGKKPIGEKEKKEYKIIAAINILFAIYTIFFTYGRANALYSLFSVHTLLVVSGWALYAASMYLVLIWSEGSKLDSGKCLATALVIGVGTGFVKAAADVSANQLFSRFAANGGMQGEINQGIRNGFMGFLFIYFLFHFLSKERCRLSNHVSAQRTVLTAVIVCYILVVMMVKVKAGMSFNSAKFHLEDIHLFSFFKWAGLGVDEIVCVNRWAFAIFMTVSWWLVRALYTEEKGEE